MGVVASSPGLVVPSAVCQNAMISHLPDPLGAVHEIELSLRSTVPVRSRIVARSSITGLSEQSDFVHLPATTAIRCVSAPLGGDLLGAGTAPS